VKWVGNVFLLPTLILKKEMTKKTKKQHDSVASDFAISLTDTEQTNPAAADLLRLCAFLYPENIPEEILKEGIKALDGHLKQIADDPEAWDEAIQEAYKTQFLRYNPNRKIMTMNYSIQTFLKQGMSGAEQRIWAEKAVQVMNHVFPDVEFSNWPQCQRLLRCAKTCTDHIIQSQLILKEAPELLSEVACYLHERAQYAQARPLYEQALAIREQMLGKTHPEVAESLNDLASLYHIMGKYTQGKPLYERALDIVEVALNNEPSEPDKLHQRRATSLNNLGSLHKAQKLYEEAKPYYKKALEVLENVLKEENANLAATLNNLAGLYEAQGEYQIAKPMYERALEIWNEAVEDDHPNISATINNLGGLYKLMGEDEKVQPLLEQALAIREQALGDHPDVAISLNNLAEFYKSIEDYAQAKPMYERAIKILKQTFESKHPHINMCVNNYEHLLSLMKKPQKRRSKRRK
jgi:tetratricopeptide (TPR) repeat protein